MDFDQALIFVSSISECSHGVHVEGIFSHADCVSSNLTGCNMNL